MSNRALRPPGAAIQREPSAALRPYVSSLWVKPLGSAAVAGRPGREWVLPSAQMHLVLRLGGDRFRLYRGASDPSGQWMSQMLVGGIRSGAYLRDPSAPGWSVGAQCRAGASLKLFGVPASLLAERHTALEDLWGDSAQRLRQQLQEAASPMRQLDILEAALLARLEGIGPVHPAVRLGLKRVAGGGRVAVVAAECGLSHRRFDELFLAHVGLMPKAYSRLQRFQGAVLQLHRDSARSLADLALAWGYSDQAHLSRDFREFSGMTPSEYRRAAPARALHVVRDWATARSARIG